MTVLKFRNEYNAVKKSFDIVGFFDLTNSTINFSKINYKKRQWKKIRIKF